MMSNCNNVAMSVSRLAPQLVRADGEEVSLAFARHGEAFV